MSATVAATVVAGFGGSFGLYWYQRRKKRQRVRKALIAELKATGDRIDTMAGHIKRNHNPSEGEFIFPSSDPFVTHAYEANVSDISLLSEPEVAALTDYYARVTIARNMIEACRSADEPPKQVLDPLGEYILSLSNDRLDVIGTFENTYED